MPDPIRDRGYDPAPPDPPAECEDCDRAGSGECGGCVDGDRRVVRDEDPDPCEGCAFRLDRCKLCRNGSKRRLERDEPDRPDEIDDVSE